MPVIRQTESAECGLACLAMVGSWHGFHSDMSTLRARFSAGKGMTLHNMIDCATELKLSCRALQLEPEEYSALKLPCILHWDLNHFVVLKQVRNDEIVIHDPDKGRVVMSVLRSGKHFTGVALELIPSPNFEARDERKKIKLRQLTGQTPGLISALVKILIFSVALQMFSLGVPLLNQMVIDNVLVTADRSLLLIIIIAISLIAFTQMLLSLAQKWACVFMSENFNMQWASNIYHHLMRLPLGWFDSRSRGSICARFDAVDTIQEAITEQLLEGILDVIVVITSLVVMLLYSPELTMIAIISAAIYGFLRAIWYPVLKRTTEELWDAETRESAHFMETLSGIMSLRVNGVTARREAMWLNLNVSRRNASIRHEYQLMFYEVGLALMNSLASAAVLWKGSSAVIDGTFTIGMLVAYISFQGRFSTSICGLTDKFFEWRMLDVYNERLSDIVMTPREGENENNSFGNDITMPMSESSSHYEAVESGWPLVLNNVTFSYRGSRQTVLDSLSLIIAPGEVLAVTGKSGCGKTTLVKLILGIHFPDEGTIYAFGIPHTHPGYTQIRQRIGTVLQDDHLFSGSIEDNIIFFSDTRDHKWMSHCARLAMIDQDINAMPMGYQTLTGEGGSNLSGGQKQRILLARALYKKPGLLLLDEATSHLDVESEILISQALRQLDIPVLLIAHRPQTIASADRVLLMDRGCLKEVL